MWLSSSLTRIATSIYNDNDCEKVSGFARSETRDENSESTIVICELASTINDVLEIVRARELCRLATCEKGGYL